MGRTERREAPSCEFRQRAWRVAPRLAVPCFFRFRTPLSGEHGVTPVVCRRPGSFATGPEFRVWELFRTLVLERLRLPLEVVESQCECGTLLDTLGRHRAACPRSGRLKKRAGPPERTMARICREAGATVRFNTRLREMNVAVSANDERSIEVLASGLPLHHGAQLAVALTCGGNAHPQVASTNGVVLTRARADKERKYAEFLESERCRLVVVALETGGRWRSDGVHGQSCRCPRT